MKVLLAGILGIIFVFGSVMALSAEENDIFNISYSLILNNIAFMNLAPDFFANENELIYRDFSIGQRVGAGFLNIFFGLGSFIMGDRSAGISILVIDILSFASIYGGMNIINFFTSAEGGLELFVLAFVFTPIGGLLVVCGALLVIASLIVGFSAPAIYQRQIGQNNHRLSLRNWNIGLIPDKRGKLNGQITFSVNF